MPCRLDVFNGMRYVFPPNSFALEEGLENLCTGAGHNGGDIEISAKLRLFLIPSHVGVGMMMGRGRRVRITLGYPQLR